MQKNTTSRYLPLAVDLRFTKYRSVPELGNEIGVFNMENPERHEFSRLRFPVTMLLMVNVFCSTVCRVSRVHIF